LSLQFVLSFQQPSRPRLPLQAGSSRSSVGSVVPTCPPTRHPPTHPHPDASLSRQKATEQEAKLRAAIQDKNTFQLEKAGLERELKAVRQQAEKLTKSMDKVGVGLVS
jgi:hypothetical protein